MGWQCRRSGERLRPVNVHRWQDAVKGTSRGALCAERREESASDL